MGHFTVSRIWISEPGQPFRSQIVLYRPDIGWWSRHSIWLAGATRLTRSDFRLNLLLLKGQGCVTWNSVYIKVRGELSSWEKRKYMGTAWKPHKGKNYYSVQGTRTMFLYTYIFWYIYLYICNVFRYISWSRVQRYTQILSMNQA